MKPAKLSDEQIQNTLATAVKSAVDFIESEISPDRITAQRYFDGDVDLEHEEGRSKIVATKCRDTVRAIKPALMRVFLQTDKPVEFTPRRPDAVAGAEQATSYAQLIFQRNNGFTVLSDAFHDALVKKVGIVKVYHDETKEVEFDDYTGLSEEQLALVLSDPETEIIEQETEEQFDGSVLYNLKVAHQSARGEIRFDSVAPEDFFVDRAARDIETCYVCGHSTVGRVGDLVEMGFDFEEVYSLGGAADGTVDEEEQMARTGWDSDQDDESALDPSMRNVLITEAYMRMDIEGTGIPRRYKFICAGQDYKILDRELCDHNPFAVFEVDPEPHTFFGRSLVDIITDDQDAATSMLRGLLDAIAMANNPRMAAVVSQVNMDDLLNGEIGGVIRVKSLDALREITIGTAAAAALPAIQHYDEVIRGKTGVTGAAMGMDADALQGQTATGVNAAVQAATAVSELIARTLAEGGMRQLFTAIVKLARQHPNPDEMMRLEGQFVPVDPRSWSTDLDVIANVGLGTGRHEERAMVLRETLQHQTMIYQTYGPQNGLVTMTNIRNTLADILRLGGVFNADRHFNQMNPQIEQQLMQQAAQAAQGQQGSDPNQAFMQVEQMKAQMRSQTEMAKLQAQGQAKASEEERLRLKAIADHDLERDKMTQDLAVKAAEILAKYGIAVDTAQIRQQQAGIQGPMANV